MTEQEWSASSDVSTLLAFVAGRDAPPGAVLPQVPLSERKLRLFLVACCRRQWDLFTDPRCRQVVEVAERLADGLADEAERAHADQSALTIRNHSMMEMLAPDGPGKNHPGVLLMLTADAAGVACWPFADLTRQHTYFGRSPSYVPLHPRDRSIRADYVPHKLGYAAAEDAAHRLGDAAPKWHVLDNAEQAAQADLLRCIGGNPFCPVLLDPAWLAWNSGTVPKLARSIYDERAFARLPILADALEDAGCADPGILAHCRSGGEHARGCWPVDLLLRKS